MLVVVEVQIALGFLVLSAEDAVGRSELGHDQPAATQVANEAAEDGIGDTGHRCQHRGRSDLNSTN